MKRTKAQLQAQLTTAQSLVVRHQATIKKQHGELHELRQDKKTREVELRHDNIALTARVLELETRLQNRGGQLDMLKKMTLELAHGYKKYR